MLHAVGYLSFIFNNLIFVTEEFIRALVIQGCCGGYKFPSPIEA